MTNPVTYASARQFIGAGIETVQGTAVAPTVTIPMDRFDPRDSVTWIDDKALRGSMVGLYGKNQGPLHTEFDAGGPVFFDTIGFLLSNLLGDVVDAGAYTGSGTTTLAADVAANATTISTAASISSSTRIQIGTGTSAEVRTTTGVSGGGPYSVTFAGGLRSAHSSGATVKPITTPYDHTFSVLNNGEYKPGLVYSANQTAQPGSLTLTDWQGPVASTYARAYAGCCLSEITIKGNAESTNIEWEGKGVGWPSAAAASTPTSSPSTETPLAAWRYQLGLGGPASGGTLVANTAEFSITISRMVEPIFTGQNSQSPYFIQRGPVTVTGNVRYSAIASEASSLTYMLANTQPQMQLLISNGGSGSTLRSLQIDLAAAAFVTAQIDRSKAAVGYQSTIEAISTTTNAGYSAGYSPISLLLRNATAPLSY